MPLFDLMPALLFLMLNVFIPGPNVLNTIATAMGSGLRAGMACACACGAGLLLWALAVLFGAAAMFAALPVAQAALTAFWWAAAAVFRLSLSAKIGWTRGQIDGNPQPACRACLCPGLHGDDDQSKGADNMACRHFAVSGDCQRCAAHHPVHPDGGRGVFYRSRALCHAVCRAGLPAGFICGSIGQSMRWSALASHSMG